MIPLDPVALTGLFGITIWLNDMPWLVYLEKDILAELITKRANFSAALDSAQCHIVSLIGPICFIPLLMITITTSETVIRGVVLKRVHVFFVMFEVVTCPPMFDKTVKSVG